VQKRIAKLHSQIGRVNGPLSERCSYNNDLLWRCFVERKPSWRWQSAVYLQGHIKQKKLSSKKRIK
jgi:hypothetical protein